MDVIDGLVVVYCYFLQMGCLVMEKGYSGWKDFIVKNFERVKQ